MGSLWDFVNCLRIWKLWARKDNANDCFLHGSLLQLTSTFSLEGTWNSTESLYRINNAIMCRKRNHISYRIIYKDINSIGKS